MDRRTFVARSLPAMLLALLGLRLPKALSLSRNSQVPCWDCGQLPIDEKDRQAVALGFNCQTCFDRDTGELRNYPRWVATPPPLSARIQPSRQLTEATLRKAYLAIVNKPPPVWRRP